MPPQKQPSAAAPVSTPPPPPAGLTVAVMLPTALADRLARDPQAASMPLPEALVRYVEQFVGVPWNQSRPLHLSDSQRSAIESALGRSVRGEDDLVALVQSRASISVAGMKIKLDPEQLEILAARCGDSMTLEEFAEEVVRRGIGAFLQGGL